ncbi:MAG: type II toxin-antitoxin system VapC family toxin [Candidatus Bathyarchaeia archaeon]
MKRRKKRQNGYCGKRGRRTSTPILEVDLLYAALDPEDRHHRIARRTLSFIKKRKMPNVKVDSLALHELELNLKTGNILIKGSKATPRDIAKFFTDLNRLLSLYRMEILPLTCPQIAKAADLRGKHKLSFYDSHHASTALLYDSKIISTDTTYDNIKDLTRIDPYILKSTRSERS